MKSKKTEKADIESKKGMFFQIGLVSALVVTIIALEWSKSEIETKIPATGEIEYTVIQKEIIPVTRAEKHLPSPPPVPSTWEEFEIDQQEVYLDYEIDIEETEPRVKREEFRIKTTTEEKEEEAEFGEDHIYLVVQQMPTFQGKGREHFRRWVRENLSYPKEAIEKGIQGRVMLQFVVERDGRVSNVEIMRGAHPLLDEEAVRVLESSPRWEPGFHKGKPARVRYMYQFNFVLEKYRQK